MTEKLGAAIAAFAQAATAPPSTLISEVDRFRLVRENTLEVLAQVSTAQSVWSPRGGVWSITQIADHLLRTEELYRDQFRQLIQRAMAGDSSPIRIGLSEVNSSFAGIPRGVMQLFELPARMMSQFMPSAVREAIIRYPIVPTLNPGVSDPRPGTTIQKVRTDLALSLAKTESLLGGILPANYDEPRVVHPIMGSTNIPELFRVVIVHEERHQLQIAGLRANAGYPRG